MTSLQNFLDTTNFMPHGHCYLWKSELIWLNVISDAVITFSYYLIPVLLIYFILKRRDIPFNWVFFLFGTFIVACGTTHLMEIINVWNSHYYLSAFIKVITGVVSVGTAIALLPLIPKAMKIPTPGKFQETSEKLESEIEQRKKLEKSESEIRKFLDAAPCGMMAVNQNGKIILVNKHAESLFGYNRDELINQSVDMLVPHEFAKYHPHHRNQFIENPQTRSMGVGRDLKGLKKDGTEFPLEIGLNPITRDGKLIVLCSIIDITERKRAEQELKLKNEELSKLAKIKTDFTSMVSHELRTPLTAIKEGISLVLDGVDGPINDDQRETLKITKDSVERLNRLINNVLNFSRMESGKMEWFFEKVSMNELVEEAFKIMNLSANHKTINLTLELPQNEIMSICDADKIKQVIINLIDNAIKFSDEKKEIHIKLFKEDDQCAISVKDFGIGLSPEDQKRIFESFEQVRSKGLWKTGGSGLGLSICQQIIDKHKGHIKLDSKLNEGSTFTIYLSKNLKESVE